MNPFDISGKVILVTGGTRGLGRALSMHLASQGAIISAGYFQNEQSAEEFRQLTAQKNLKCSTVKANLMTGGGIQALVDYVKEAYGRVDALIYNSATGVHRRLEELTQRHLATVWQVNVGAFLDLSVKLKPLMPPGARIIAISSEGARKAVDEYGAIGSSKGALESLCRQMAAEWSSAAIAVNMISPGLLQTDTLAAMNRAEARISHEKGQSLLGRLIELEEVAYVAHFLCSRASDGIIGQTLIVDGGKSISALAK